MENTWAWTGYLWARYLVVSHATGYAEEQIRQLIDAAPVDGSTSAKEEV